MKFIVIKWCVFNIVVDKRTYIKWLCKLFSKPHIITFHQFAT